MTIKIIRGRGNDRVFETFLNSKAKTRRGIRRGFYESGKLLESDIKKSILKKPKSGRVYPKYIRGNRRGTYRASAPGEAIANVSGTTRKSTDFLVKGARELEIGFDSTAPYSKYPEFGSDRIKRRGTILLSIQKNQRNIKRLLASNVNKEFR